MTSLLILSLVAYAVTFILTSSIIFLPIKLFIRSKTKFLFIKGVHPLDCRMCAGFWVSIFVCLLNNEYSVKNILFVFAISYFLATQERR